MNDWIITLPQKVEWEDYARELRVVERPGKVLNYRVPHFPKALKVGDRCWLVWRGMVRGWMEIVRLEHWSTGFRCSTTNTQWPAGKYIQRAGLFHAVSGPYMRGFQGIRSFPAGADLLKES